MRKNVKSFHGISILGKRISIFEIVLYLIMIVLMCLTIYPIWFSVINSLSDGSELRRNGLALLLPDSFTLESWKVVLTDAEIIQAFLVTASRTIIVTTFSLLITSMFSFAFSRPYLNWKKLYVGIGFVSMYFSGGIIASFLLFNWLHLYDNYLVYILPCLFGGFYNVIIFNANFKEIPVSLFESAKLDGANEFQLYWKVVMPLSKPVLSALGIFTAVGIWNDYSATLFYTQDSDLQTLSYFSLKMIKSSQAIEQLSKNAMLMSGSIMDTVNGMAVDGPVTTKTIELSCMILSALPVIIAYPFAQKFFIKGVMVGSVKG